jgi:hypothetical protein
VQIDWVLGKKARDIMEKWDISSKMDSHGPFFAQP